MNSFAAARLMDKESYLMSMLDANRLRPDSSSSSSSYSSSILWRTRGRRTIGILGSKALLSRFFRNPQSVQLETVYQRAPARFDDVIGDSHGPPGITTICRYD